MRGCAAETVRFVTTAAACDLPVLLLGETGTGKSHVAREIHRLCASRPGPLVEFTCTAVPQELFSHELFGHVRGAFTGAVDSRPGAFERAKGGTLFLDEIAEVPMEAQATLLGVLDTKRTRRLGGSQELAVDVRVIAATNRRLRDRLGNGFRRDLYYRLSALEHRLPPLRRTIARLPDLARAILAEVESDAKDLDESALAVLRSHDWPGNARELVNVLRAASVRAAGPRICAHDLPDFSVASPPGDQGPPRTRYRQMCSDEDEREAILQALSVVGGNRTEAARRLGMSRTTLWMKLRLHGIA